MTSGTTKLSSGLQALLDRAHHDPHAVLGVHEISDPHPAPGLVIRALRPDATAVTAVLDDGRRIALTELHPVGLFEGRINDASLPLEYRVEADYGEHGAYTQVDPYVFGPTLGDLDLHLIGEGHHERLYELLGAHLTTHGGIHGTAFAVWAPAARSVSVVGDFNFWNGRMHPMRSLGSSGIWELFLPGVAESARYKFEILTTSGELRLKADPYAQEAELPPQTASVVTRSRHTWKRATRHGSSAAPTQRPCTSRSPSTRSTSARGDATAWSTTGL